MQYVEPLGPMDIHNIQEHHVSDEMFYRAAGWDSISDTTRRITPHWVGHIARMPVTRVPQQMLLGWWAGHQGKNRFGVVLQPIWLRVRVRDANIPEIDWFRMLNYYEC